MRRILILLVTLLYTADIYAFNYDTVELKY